MSEWTAPDYALAVWIGAAVVAHLCAVAVAIIDVAQKRRRGDDA